LLITAPIFLLAILLTTSPLAIAKLDGPWKLADHIQPPPAAKMIWGLGGKGPCEKTRVLKGPNQMYSSQEITQYLHEISGQQHLLYVKVQGAAEAWDRANANFRGKLGCEPKFRVRARRGSMRPSVHSHEVTERHLTNYDKISEYLVRAVKEARDAIVDLDLILMRSHPGSTPSGGIDLGIAEYLANHANEGLQAASTARQRLQRAVDRIHYVAPKYLGKHAPRPDKKAERNSAYFRIETTYGRMPVVDHPCVASYERYRDHLLLRTKALRSALFAYFQGFIDPAEDQLISLREVAKCEKARFETICRPNGKANDRNKKCTEDDSSDPPTSGIQPKSAEARDLA
jgi:hypothetical protein